MAAEEKTIYHQLYFIVNELMNVYKELIEMSTEIEYRDCIQESERCAEDDLKTLSGFLMDEIQKLYPKDY